MWKNVSARPRPPSPRLYHTCCCHVQELERVNNLPRPQIEPVTSRSLVRHATLTATSQPHGVYTASSQIAQLTCLESACRLGSRCLGWSVSTLGLSRCCVSSGSFKARDLCLMVASVTSALNADWSTASASATRSPSSNSPSSSADSRRARTLDMSRVSRAALRRGLVWKRPDAGPLVGGIAFSLDTSASLNRQRTANTSTMSRYRSAGVGKPVTVSN